MTDRRQFIKQATFVASGYAFSNLVSPFLSFSKEKSKLDFKISLAEWSLHKALFSNKITNLDFPEIAKKQFGIEAVEYVNQFFKDKATDITYLNQLKQRCEDNGVKSVLIMIDQEGPLADKDENLRKKAVENHYKWVDAAKHLGCHAIRVNLHGDSNAEQWTSASIKSLTSLTEYASKLEMNILAENHGTFSSHGAMLAKVIKDVNQPRCNTIVDFANFCVRRRDGDLWSSPCVESYDRYKGVEELLPYAKAVSAKTFDFDSGGNETTIDYKRMLQLVKTSTYNGYIGVEYEGERLSEDEGIKATKKLLERLHSELNE